MPDSEFSIIEQYFDQPNVTAAEVSLGIGDDAALLSLPDGAEFFSRQASLAGPELQMHPASAAHGLLRHGLARLAKCSARPISFTLSLTLPDLQTAWLQQFSSRLHQEARRIPISLVGGDTSRGPWLAVVHCHGVR